MNWFVVSSFICFFLSSTRCHIKLYCFAWQVDSRLHNFKDAVSSNKTFLDEHVSVVNNLANDAKRKWETFSMQAENDASEGADFSAAKHCRMELLLQQS